MLRHCHGVTAGSILLALSRLWRNDRYGLIRASKLSSSFSKRAQSDADDGVTPCKADVQQSRIQASGKYNAFARLPRLQQRLLRESVASQTPIYQANEVPNRSDPPRQLNTTATFCSSSCMDSKGSYRQPLLLLLLP